MGRLVALIDGPLRGSITRIQEGTSIEFTLDNGDVVTYRSTGLLRGAIELWSSESPGQGSDQQGEQP
jgi:hypothetical protein